VAQQHRDEVVEAASHAFRERGIEGASVAELMGAAGLTHGGFYKHFASKDALAALACGAAFDAMFADLHASAVADPRRALLDHYLSVSQRDAPADGCPATAFARDVSLADAASALRSAYLEGVRGFVDSLQALDPAEADEGDNEETDDAGRDRALATMATMVGALTLARATAGDPISERFLAAARSALEPDETGEPGG
jgi:TetR/AcrR family transcriptional repressor of nem operon